MSTAKRLVVLTSLTLVSACAAPQKAPRPTPQVEMKAPPQDRAEARRRLAYYVARLESERRALGLELSGGEPYRPEAVPEGPAARPPARAEAETNGRPAARSKRASKPRAPAPSADARADSGRDDVRFARPRDRSDCPMVCRHARAICSAADHICRIADYLDEIDARQRCARAREDCRQAKERTRGRCGECER